MATTPTTEQPRPIAEYLRYAEEYNLETDPTRQADVRRDLLRWLPGLEAAITRLKDGPTAERICKEIKNALQRTVASRGTCYVVDPSFQAQVSASVTTPDEKLSKGVLDELRRLSQGETADSTLAAAASMCSSTAPENNAVPMFGDDVVRTVNRMLANNPEWNWKTTKNWLKRHHVSIFGRDAWRRQFGSGPPARKGNVAIVNGSDLMKALRTEQEVDNRAFERMDSLDNRKASIGRK